MAIALSATTNAVEARTLMTVHQRFDRAHSYATAILGRLETIAHRLDQPSPLTDSDKCVSIDRPSKGLVEDIHADLDRLSSIMEATSHTLHRIEEAVGEN